MRTHYRITEDVAVRLCWAEPVLGEAARAAFQQFGLEEVTLEEMNAALGARPPATIHLLASEAPPEAPPEAEPVAAFDDAPLSAYRAGSLLFLVGARAVVRLDPAAGTAEARIHAPADAEALRRHALGAGVMSLFVLLRHRQLFPMHAAALAHPQTGAGVLFTAHSDSGKSTLACSLVRQGWRYLSDDSILLRLAPAAADGSEAGPVEAMAFRRNFTLDTEARGFFPEIAQAWSALPGPEEKWAVAMADLFPGGAARRCVPRLIVFPEIAEGEEESTLHPVPRVEAMHRVLSQCALVTLEPEAAPAHLDIARRLVGQTRHLRLSAGRDVIDRPRRVAALLEEALMGAPSFS